MYITTNFCAKECMLGTQGIMFKIKNKTLLLISFVYLSRIYKSNDIYISKVTEKLCKWSYFFFVSNVFLSEIRWAISYIFSTCTAFMLEDL